MMRADPMEVRRSIMVAEEIVHAGLDFVPVPVKNDQHKQELIALSERVMQELIAEEEGRENE